MQNNIDQYLDRLEARGPGKVYCRECRFLGQVRRRPSPMFFYTLPPALDADTVSHRCLHPHARHPTTMGWGPRDIQLHPSMRNADNDCPDFYPLRWEQWWGLGVVLVGGLLVVGYLVCWGWPF